MTLRDETKMPLNRQIANIIREHGYTTLEAANAILALVLAHATSDEAVDRAVNAFDNTMWGEEETKHPAPFRAAIKAALEVE